ncbi:hypothetical protein PENSTE_c013G00862 [Penicillium steckii]|uniref:Uncharacterized protein n=1 Tax=Penicillium steckii TaxID=303698 RepID=A0A1V6T2G6_9EURO|nr:hypothetical protein PENSTE_c013G00862 [Penicillium steckii]
MERTPESFSSADESDQEVHEAISNEQISKYHSLESNQREQLKRKKPLEADIIARLYKYCLRAYRSLIGKVCVQESSDASYLLQEIENGYQLLVIWGHDFDTADGGLDTRLEDSHDIKVLTISLLVSLAHLTFQAFQWGSTPVPPLMFSLDCDLNELVREADGILQDTTDSDNDGKSSSSQYDVETLDDFNEAVEDIKSTIQNLFDVIPAIETPARTRSNRKDILVSDATKAAISEITAKEDLSLRSAGAVYPRGQVRERQTTSEIEESKGIASRSDRRNAEPLGAPIMQNQTYRANPAMTYQGDPEQISPQMMEHPRQANLGILGDPVDSRISRQRGKLPNPETDILRDWFHEHPDHPYPSEEDKQMFMTKTGLTISQVSNWFINARRRELPALRNQMRQISQGDTQPLSQFTHPPKEYGSGMEEENPEDVWGYLLPLDDKVDSVICLKTRETPETSKTIKGKEKSDTENRQPGGYLVGRHPECGDRVAILEDLSTNGTFVNDAIVGRNRHRQLEDGDEIAILNEARFVFRYPRSRYTNGFRQQYLIQHQLGKGHFATVYLCVEIATGNKYAVKVFGKVSKESQGSQMLDETLYQEIALLKGVNHPSLIFLREMFDEDDGVYLVLELAPEGELFNLIVSREKLTEDETRHVFRQLFEGLNYLHVRGIVHRDIKPENILVIDENLTVKLGDFGLAKLIGEESFTTTLCGTPSYVAPEILQENRRRRYARSVDIWSLGVVLYICLCGFPPFSDELYTEQNPYSLAQQIKMGRFDYPSPYWDSIDDQALDLIDKMLTVDSEKRLTVEECLEHPWMKNEPPIVDAEGLTGALVKLDFSKRKVERERTLLSSVNDSFYEVFKGGSGGVEDAEFKVFEKTAAEERIHNPVSTNVHQDEKPVI